MISQYNTLELKVFKNDSNNNSPPVDELDASSCCSSTSSVTCSLKSSDRSLLSSGNWNSKRWQGEETTSSSYIENSLNPTSVRSLFADKDVYANDSNTNFNNNRNEQSSTRIRTDMPLTTPVRKEPAWKLREDVKRHGSRDFTPKIPKRQWQGTSDPDIKPSEDEKPIQGTSGCSSPATSTIRPALAHTPSNVKLQPSVCTKDVSLGSDRDPVDLIPSLFQPAFVGGSSKRRLSPKLPVRTRDDYNAQETTTIPTHSTRTSSSHSSSIPSFESDHGCPRPLRTSDGVTAATTFGEGKRKRKGRKKEVMKSATTTVPLHPSRREEASYKFHEEGVIQEYALQEPKTPTKSYPTENYLNLKEGSSTLYRGRNGDLKLRTKLRTSSRTHDRMSPKQGSKSSHGGTKSSSYLPRRHLTRHRSDYRGRRRHVQESLSSILEEDNETLSPCGNPRRQTPRSCPTIITVPWDDSDSSLYSPLDSSWNVAFDCALSPNRWSGVGRRNLDIS